MAAGRASAYPLRRAACRRAAIPNDAVLYSDILRAVADVHGNVGARRAEIFIKVSAENDVVRARRSEYVYSIGCAANLVGGKPMDDPVTSAAGVQAENARP